MDKLVIRVLRVTLIVLLVGSVLGQVIVPGYGYAVAETNPGIQLLVIPYSVIGILIIACGQVALLVVWRLLSLVGNGVIFSRRSLRLVDIIIVCGAIATILNAAVTVHLLAAVHTGGPLMFLWLFASVAGGVAFVLLMVVMRGLLESAIADRAELDEVI